MSDLLVRLIGVALMAIAVLWIGGVWILLAGPMDVTTIVTALIGTLTGAVLFLIGALLVAV